MIGRSSSLRPDMTMTIGYTKPPAVHMYSKFTRIHLHVVSSVSTFLQIICLFLSTSDCVVEQASFKFFLESEEVSA